MPSQQLDQHFGKSKPTFIGRYSWPKTLLQLSRRAVYFSGGQFFSRLLGRGGVAKNYSFWPPGMLN